MSATMEHDFGSLCLETDDGFRDFETKTVLIADCDGPRRAMVSELLRGRGLSVVHAFTGAEALAQVKRGGIDLVVSSMTLCGMDCLELLSSLRETPAAPPVIALATGMTDMDWVYLKGASILGAARAYMEPLMPSAFLGGVIELLAPQSS